MDSEYDGEPAKMYEAMKESNSAVGQRFTKFFNTCQDLLESATEDMSWATAQSGVDTVIEQQVKENLTNSSVSLGDDADIDSITETFVTYALFDTVKTSLKESMIFNITTNEYFRELTDKLGKNVPAVEDFVSQSKELNNIYASITALLDNEDKGGYIKTVVRSTVLEQQAHYLEENASSIQQAELATDATITQTTNEISEKEQDLSDVDAELESDPDNKTLRDKQAAMQAELEKLRKEQQEAEEEKAKQQQTEQDNTDAMSSNEKQQNENEKLKEKQGNIFDE